MKKRKKLKRKYWKDSGCMDLSDQLDLRKDW